MDLALRPDFHAGPLFVSPARRLVRGPHGEAHVEPLVMQVFLLLVDASGGVVTRNELFDRIWGGVMIGDGSLNRAIAGVRKIVSETAPGLLEVETIPRTGYRLTGDQLTRPVASDLPAAAEAPPSERVSRRVVVGACAAAAAAAIAGGGIYWSNRRSSDPRFDALMDRGNEAIRLDQPAASKYFQQAAAIEPGSARAWGAVAYALASGGYSSDGLTGPTARAADRSARTALAIDANEPNALLALALVQSGILDWYAREEQFRRILAIDPRNTWAMRSLGQLLHGVGRCREALEMAERVLAIEPLTPDQWVRKAMRLWVLGRVAEADPAIDRAMQFWPSHLLVRLARLMIYAFTGRTRAALAMVESEQANPIVFMGPAAATVWRTSLAALESRTTSAIATARDTSVEASTGSPQIAAWAILTLSALGELDAAFEVANGFLLDRGSIIVRPRPDPASPHVNGAGWRNTFGLFTPPTRAMRLDPRFGPLCDGLGLTDYWRKRGIGPDAFLMRP